MKYPTFPKSQFLNMHSIYHLLIVISFSLLTAAQAVTVSISVADTSTNENSNAAVTVSLDTTSASTITVDWLTLSGSALPGSDFTSSSGSLTFDPGISSLTLTVPINDDSTDEPEETFSVKLINPVNASLNDDLAAVTILDNDDPSQVSVADGVALEGDSGTVNLTFVVSLDKASGYSVDVGVATSSGTATSGVDFQNTAYTLTFSPGETSKAATVPVNGDLLTEPDETFSLAITGTNYATIADGNATGTIVDDDPAPTLSCDPQESEEGNTLWFTFALSWASGTDVTITYQTTDGTAVAPADYTYVSSQVTIPQGSLTATIPVTTIEDSLYEADETLTLTIADVTGEAVLEDETSTGTILNDDSKPTVSISDLTVREDAGNAEVTVTLSAPTGIDTTITYETWDESAEAYEDYNDATNSLVFAAGGSQTAILEVGIVDDIFRELTETFGITLTGSDHANLGDDTAQITIEDNDRSSNVLYKLSTKGMAYSGEQAYRLRSVGDGYLLIDYRRGLAAMLQHVQVGGETVPVCQMWDDQSLIVPELDNGRYLGRTDPFNLTWSGHCGTLDMFSADLLSGSGRNNRISRWVNHVFARSLNGQGWSIPGYDSPYSGLDFVSYKTRARTDFGDTIDYNNEQLTFEELLDLLKNQLSLEEETRTDIVPTEPSAETREISGPVLVYKAKSVCRQVGEGILERQRQGGYLIFHADSDQLLWVRTWKDANRQKRYDVLDISGLFEWNHQLLTLEKDAWQFMAAVRAEGDTDPINDADQIDYFLLEGKAKETKLGDNSYTLAKSPKGVFHTVKPDTVDPTIESCSLSAKLDKKQTESAESTASATLTNLLTQLQEDGYQPTE